MLHQSDVASYLLCELAPHLRADDDVALWQAAIPVVLSEFASHLDAEVPCYLEIGACSHWLRPHQSRWNAAGGFAWPSGYHGGTGHNHRGLPVFDWSALFCFDSGAFSRVEKYSGKRRMVMRATFPTRTARHQQAVLHIISYPSNTVLFRGFRRIAGEWKLVAEE